MVAKFAKTANDLNTIASALSGMPTSILRGAHLGTTTSSTLTNAPTGATTAITISRV